MNGASDRSGLEVTETISVAGSVIGSILAVTSNQLIYAAAPLTLALSLSTINRRRFEQNFQQNMLSFLSQVNSRITETDQKIAAELRSIKDAATSLPPAAEPVNIQPIQAEISALQKRFDTLEVAIGNISSTGNFTPQPAFDPTYLEQEIQQLKTVLTSTEKIPVSSVTLEQINEVKQEIQAVQENVWSLNQAFNQRQEPSQIAQLKQTTAAIDQKIADLSLEQEIQQLQGEIYSLKQAFDRRQESSEIAELNQIIVAIDQRIADSPLKEEIQQLQASICSLKQEFNQRVELNQIAELKQATAAINQKIADTSLEQQIQQLKGEISELKQEFNQRPEPAQIKAVKEFTATVMQQMAEKEAAFVEFDPAPLEGQIQELNKAIAQIDSSQTNFTIEIAKLPQLLETVAQIQQQQSELHKLILEVKQPAASPIFPIVTFGGKIQPYRTKNKRIEAIMAMAEAHGIGKEFQLVTQAAEKNHLTLNPWPTNLVFGPADNLITAKSSKRSQCLFTISGQPTPEGKVRLWLSSQAFADFYPVMAMTVSSILGFDGWMEMTKAEIEQFVASLNRLFDCLAANPAELN